MFYRDPDHVYRVSELDSFSWLIHGFGTRLADIPAAYPQLGILKQIHSTECVAGEGRSGVLGQADALLENLEGAVVAVRTADCIPVLLVDDEHRAVAAVHAGWRGTAGGIVGRAIEAMRERFGTSAARLHAAIGPGIGECCYEVGPEVAERFGKQGTIHLDLTGENRRQLLRAGVTRGRIYASNLCTKCKPEEFHSYRRDRDDAGRLYSFAGIRPQSRR